MKTPEQLYESAIERMAQAVARRRSEPDYCAIENGAFVVDHDAALAAAAAQAVGLRELYQALCDARATLTRLQAQDPPLAASQHAAGASQFSSGPQRHAA